MSLITRADVEQYQNNIQELTKAVETLIEANKVQIDLTNQKTIHDSIQEFLEPILEASTDNAVDLSEEFYNYCRETTYGSKTNLIANNTRSPEATSKFNYYLGYEYQNGKKTFDELVQEIKNRASYEIKRQAGNSMMEFSFQDSAKPRYARVPGYSKTYGFGCPFCVMLASRGFVYLNHKTANLQGSRFDHYHSDCRCTVVPSWETKEVLTPNLGIQRYALDGTVQGYSPQKLYDQYIQLLEDGKLNKVSVSKYSLRPPNWKSETFNNYKEVKNYILDAKNMEDLQTRCAVVEGEWKDMHLSDVYKENIRKTYKHMISVLMRE